MAESLFSTTNLLKETQEGRLVELIVDEALRYLGAGGSEDDAVPPCGAYGAHNQVHSAELSRSNRRTLIFPPERSIIDLHKPNRSAGSVTAISSQVRS